MAVFILADLYVLDTFPAKLIATAFSFTVNYAGNKLLVFREEKAPLNPPEKTADEDQK